MKHLLFITAISLLTLKAHAQNVGIGTTNPVFKLDVRNGSINTDSVYRIGTNTVLAVPGAGNLFVGKDAGIGMFNTGAYNTFSGNLAGSSNTHGSYNSFYGWSAGSSNTSGDQNSFYGRSTGFSNTTGYSNSFYGVSAAYWNTTGNYNTAIGTSSLTNNTTGTMNTALGYNANVNTGALTNATAIGANARVDCNNCLVLGSGVNVGIGTTIPTEKLQVAGNIKADTVKPNAIKLTPNAGTGKTLTSDAAGNASWQARSAGGGVGFGSWGDCSTNSISEYNPVADSTGAEYDYFGRSVSISGNYAIVGAYADDGVAGADQGSASIYQWNGSSWVLMQKLTDATGAGDDQFGNSVSISGNYAIVGAPLDDGAAGADQGSVSIYQWNGSNWVLMQKLTDATGAASDWFGFSVSISGNYAIVGAYYDDGTAGADQGSASIYQWNGSNWVLMQKLTDATGATDDYFGRSVSISGNYAIVGANSDDGAAGADQGSASIYQWLAGNWILMQKLTDAFGAGGDRFGFSVSISGNYVIVGVPFDDRAAGFDQGSVSIYQWNGSNWVLMQILTDATGNNLDVFGFSVSISGNYAIVGAYLVNGVGGSPDWGSASIYLRVGLGWQKLQYITDPGGGGGNHFGYATAIDGATQRFLIGAYNYANGSGKVVFGKVN